MCCGLGFRVIQFEVSIVVYHRVCRNKVMIIEFVGYGYGVGELGTTVGLRIGQSVSLLYLYE